jgi:hypothetical protein
MWQWLYDDVLWKWNFTMCVCVWFGGKINCSIQDFIVAIIRKAHDDIWVGSPILLYHFKTKLQNMYSINMWIFYFDNWVFYYYFESEIKNYINISDFEKLHKTRKWEESKT